MTGDADDSERTIFQPGGGMPGAGATPSPSPQSQSQSQGGYVPPRPQPLPGDAPAAAPSAVKLDFAAAEPDLYGPEPVVAAAGRLIHLASRIQAMPIGPDLSSLRRLAVTELEAFGPRARKLGLEPKSIQLAHYILCAFIDDAVMSTPWGANSQWSQQSLLAAYHNDTQGGDRMFQFAERMVQDPDREPRLMELLYQCLALGFEGRAALDPRGESLLHQRRAKLASAIVARNAASPADLAPQWKGQTVAIGRFAPRIPLWAILSALAAVALLIFAALLFRLSTQAGAAIAALDKTVGAQQVVPAAPPAPETATPTFDKVQSILAPDIRADRLELAREGNEIVIRLHNQGLFASAQAEASGSWSATFTRLAEAANLTRGPMRIEGHTDDQAIRASLTFPSNQELSEARAKSVAEALAAAGLADPSRIATSGLGETRPIARNDSDDGRRQNRRVEIRVANDVNWR